MEYVESIISLQQIVRIETPAGNSRKKQHLAPSSVWGDDEYCAVDGDSPSPWTRKGEKKARRTIVQSPSSPLMGGRLVFTGADIHVSAESTVERLINKLSTNVHSMFSDMSSRIEKLESGLEQRISKKVAQLLDKRVNAEMSNIKKAIDTKIKSVKDEIAADIAEIKETIDDIKLERPSAQTNLSRTLLFAIYNNQTMNTSNLK